MHNAQRTKILTINVDETGWIVKNKQAQHVSLPWMAEGVNLCIEYYIIGNFCEHVDNNFPKGLHSTYEEFSRPNQRTVSLWLDASHSLSWPGLLQGN